MPVSVIIFIYIGTLALVSNKTTATNTSLPPSGDQNLSTADLDELDTDREVSKNNTNLYQFIVRIVYSTKVYNLGILFRPRYVLAPFMKLYFYNELGIYVTAWADENFQNRKLIRRIIHEVSYTNRLPLCDFQLSVLEIESPFESSSSYWKAHFMSYRKPDPGTACKIIHFSLHKLHEVDTKVVDWDYEGCEAQLGYLSNCERDTFVCFSVDTPVEVDISGSLVLCKNKIAAAIPGYFIREIIPIQFLPFYRNWFYNNSNNLMRPNSSDVVLGTYACIVMVMLIFLPKSDIDI